eukprot:CAMPEP_0177659672 /NCGR_PEP_ID=MMETSP0447-20121125/17576_1 /TAXON_ID=0 /ORGANISM="Stygamoeba regulata, Strain BSH-02190019" /LENGTH=100 /DNA_ID=CAMNT_0019164575 /DNA_START=104 /DNA_END=403 /DNA_ORIENTATION=-
MLTIGEIVVIGAVAAVVLGRKQGGQILRSGSKALNTFLKEVREGEEVANAAIRSTKDSSVLPKPPPPTESVRNATMKGGNEPPTRNLFSYCMSGSSLRSW